MQMRTARLYAYNEPLRLEEIPVPSPGLDEVLIKVDAAGMCRSDFQLMEGYFARELPVSFPITPGHEVAGTVAGLGRTSTRSHGFGEGDLVVVNPNWGDGVCRQCHEGNEHLCQAGQLIGFGPPGGFAEYLVVPSRQAIPVGKAGQGPQMLAPLTDAGLTPYRGMKKLCAAGRLGAGRTVAVTGIGGLGSYAIQYAKLMGAGATVVGIARSEEKLTVAKENGADHTVNVRDKSVEDVQDELEDLTGRRVVDAVLDCAGAEESLALGFSILSCEGALASVGLIGRRADVPLFPFVHGEQSYFGSFWGNHNDLTEVLALAEANLIKHHVTTVKLDDINDNLAALGRGDVVGRAVVVFD